MLILQLFLLYCLAHRVTFGPLMPIKAAATNTHDPIDEWPQSITDKMYSWLKRNHNDLHISSASIDGAVSTIYTSTTYECDWLNLVLHRCFLSLRSSPNLAKMKWAFSMCAKINLLLIGNSFLQRVEITNLLLGDNSPHLSGIRLLKGGDSVLTQDDLYVVPFLR